MFAQWTWHEVVAVCTLAFAIGIAVGFVAFAHPPPMEVWLR